MTDAKKRIVTLCGSTRFYPAFQRANYEETMAGRIVLSVGFYAHTAEQSHGETVGCTPEEKERLDHLHFDKIAMSDEILVLNVGGYVGESTRNEIAYALIHSKVVRFLEGDDVAWFTENADDIHPRVAAHIEAGRGPRMVSGRAYGFVTAALMYAIDAGRISVSEAEEAQKWVKSLVPHNDEATTSVLADLEQQIRRLRANHCPTMRFGFSPEEIANAVRAELDEVVAEPIGSERAREEACGVIAVAVHLAIVHGADVEKYLSAEVLRLRRRLDHVEAGGTWAEAKEIEKQGYPIRAPGGRIVGRLYSTPAATYDPTLESRDATIDEHWLLPEGLVWQSPIADGHGYYARDKDHRFVWREDGVGDWHGTGGIDAALATSAAPIIRARNLAARHAATPPTRDRTTTPRLYAIGGFCYAAMHTHPRATFEEAIHAHIDEVLATFGPARIATLEAEVERLAALVEEWRTCETENARACFREKTEMIAAHAAAIERVREEERARLLPSPNGLAGIDDDPARWAALHDPMLQAVYAWRAEQLREGGQALTTVPFMALVHALRDFREKVACAAAATLVAERDALAELCRRAIKYAREDRMRTPRTTRLQRVLDEMARAVAPRSSTLDSGDNAPSDSMARVHASTRGKVIAFCEEVGYGCTITEAACAWALRPPTTPSIMAEWLRALADRFAAPAHPERVALFTVLAAIQLGLRRGDDLARNWQLCALDYALSVVPGIIEPSSWDDEKQRAVDEMFKHAKPTSFSRENVGLPGVPAPSSSAYTDDEFVILDSRSAVGNCGSWWAPNGKGYVCNIDDAGRYTREQAMRKRDTDIPVPLHLALAYVVRHVRVDQLCRSYDLQPGRKTVEQRMEGRKPPASAAYPGETITWTGEGKAEVGGCTLELHDVDHGAVAVTIDAPDGCVHRLQHRNPDLAKRMGIAVAQALAVRP